MGFYPIVLDLTGRPCLVVGGGAVAERKVEGLLEAGARVTVVSPTVSRRLPAWIDACAIRWVDFHAGDVAGHVLVMAATDDATVNGAVSAAAQGPGVWVNAADDPARCGFFLPSVLRRGELTVAVSTGGTGPALAQAIREELETYFTDDYRVLARVAAETRRELRRNGPPLDAESWRRALKALLATP